MNDIQTFIGRDTLTVSEAMQQIDKNTCGILFLVDETKKLVGCITDGDVRRYLLAGGKMSGAAIGAANKNPRVAHDISEARQLYHKKNYTAIPVINYEGIIVDLYNGDGNQKQKMRNPLNIPVVINAGGKGTRLDPFTRVLPKPLIPIGEQSIIELIMREYQTYSCDEFHIIVNYKKELIKAYFADNENRYNITWHDEEEPLGTGGGLSLLRGMFNSTFFFANCDALLTANYENMIKFHKENGNAITMICAYKNVDIPYGVVEMGPNGIVEDMKEKPIMSFLTNTGIYIVEPEIINYIEEGESIGFPDVLMRAKSDGKRTAAFPVSEVEWMDMGQLPELEKMRAKLNGK